MKREVLMSSLHIPDVRETVNISVHLKKHAATDPNRKAVIVPMLRGGDGRRSYDHYTFAWLDGKSDNYARGFVSAGIHRGTKTIVMVRPGIDFIAITFALFKIGSIPVFVDPGMGIRRMLHCFNETGAQAFIGIPIAHVIRVLGRGYFRTLKSWITVGRRWFWGGFTLEDMDIDEKDEFVIAESEPDELAAISFTTGSTGPAKGVSYTWKNMDAMLRQLKEQFNPGPGDIDCPTFPLFALFDAASGCTALLPDMDPQKPAQVNPDNIIEAVRDYRVSMMFASPALLNRVGRYCRDRDILLPSLRTVISGGAPVSGAIMRCFKSVMSDEGELYATYGATECLPISSIGSRERLEPAMESMTNSGMGTCVGFPCGLDVRIIVINDLPVDSLSEDILVQGRSIGEIIISGDHVSPGYYERPADDALAKINDRNKTWHRTGDLGWIDAQGRIWFCGRKKHRVVTDGGTLYSIPCEAVFNTHPAVFRSALVGVPRGGYQKPVMCIELEKAHREMNADRLERELLQIARRKEITKNIDTILFHPSFPVDIRHNAKIFREKLALWAAARLK